MSWVGQSVPRKEGVDKVTGRTSYIDDLTFPNMIHGATVRSTIPRGKIKNILFEKGVNWDEFTVVTAKDIPGKNVVALILEDQPYLADQYVNHPDEAILLLAHPDKHILQKAKKLVQIEYEKLPAIFSIQDSLKKKHVIWGQDNIQKSYLVDKGDVDSIWQTATHIIEGEYSTGAQEHLYIENNGMIATANSLEGVTVWGSLQCPYYVHKALKSLFPLPDDKVRVVQTATGGGFGGKEEYPSMLAGHAALLAWKSGRPVKMIYDRAEDMAATTKRHPSLTRHKTAVDQNGKLLAMEIEFVLDGGAYATLSSVVLSRGTLHAAGPYRCDHIRIKSCAVATNHPPHGAFRGFGAPQSIFALERHMNEIAHVIGLSPEEFRKRNFLNDGETGATGQVMRDGVDMSQLQHKALEKADYFEKQKEFSAENKKSHIKKGVGFASFYHGAGFTGSGERMLASVVGVGITKDGMVQVMASSTEIGQGANTVFTQIAADALTIPLEKIEVLQPDTKKVPNSGPTVASRTTMVVGGLVEKACDSLKQTLIQSGMLKSSYTNQEFSHACKLYLDKFGELKVYSEYKQPPHIHWDDKTYKGDAYGTYAWATYVATVAVNTRTFETQVEDFVALQEIGKVVNPILAAGQIEGGVVQGIGFGLYEKVVYKDGAVLNNQMTNYIIPTAMDVPKIRVFFEEKPYNHGPQGAKGIGELPLDGAAPAVINAVQNALGIVCNSIPMLPEDLLERLEQYE